MLKNLLKNAFVYAAVPQLPKLVTLFTYPILTSYLTSTDYGVYGVVTAYVGIIGILKEFGFVLLLVNVFYKHRLTYKIVWRHIHGLLYLWSVVYAILLGVLLYFQIPKEAESNRWWIIGLTCLPVVFFENVQTISAIHFRIKERPMPLAVFSAIGSLVAVVVTLVAVVVFKLGYMGWFISSFVASFVLFNLHGFYAYGKEKLFPIVRIRFQYMRKYLRVSAPMILHDYSGYLLNTSDRVVMNVLKVNISQIGFYNVAYLFGSYFSIFETAMGMAASPIFLRYYSQNKMEEARRLTYLSQMVFLLVSFLACLWMREIFILLIRNAELKEAYGLGIIIVMGYNYKPMYQASTNVLFFKEKTAAILKVSFVAGLLNLILNFILIPIWGFKAAAFTTFGCLLYMGFAGFFQREYKASKPLNYYPLAWLLAIIGTTCIAYFLRDMPVYGKIAISAVLFIVIAIMFSRNKDYFLKN